jgi:dTDP-glucose 4,6-dehydratase
MTIKGDTLLVTGGAGFIGAHLVERLVLFGHQVVDLDLLTYAGNLENLAGIAGDRRHMFVQGDICDRRLVRKLFSEHSPTTIVNFAAETHVDRSIDAAERFIETNVRGVLVLLEEALAHWRALKGDRRRRFRFIQISTDEVYGSISEGLFTEQSNYAPNSPYAASKAAGDHLVRAFGMTYGLPTVLVHASNTYGPRQYPEKLVPHMILSGIRGQPLPVYGEGKNVRDWLFVGDLIEGLLRVLARGLAGEVYNLAGGNERKNIDTVTSVCAHLDRLRPAGAAHATRVAFVKDRPGHDFRYAMSNEKAIRALGWVPRVSFEDGIAQTVSWYVANLGWCESVLRRGYDCARIGTRAFQ